MIIFAGSGLAARWPCRTGIVTRSEACRASRRRPELGGVAAKAAASLAASFPSRTPVSGPQRHCPRSTTGAREGEPQASRCRSRVRVPSVDPNVTAPGLRPGPGRASRKASRCRSRVRVPSVDPNVTAPGLRPGPGRASRRRVDAVPASAFRQWTPMSLPPVYDRGRGRASRRRVDAVPASAFPSVDPNVTAPGLRPGAREGEPQASRCRSRVRISVSGPQRHCPRSTTGGAGGRAARRVDAVPASAFRQWTPTSLPPVYDRGRGRASRRRVDAVPASAFAVAASRRSCETFLGCRVRVVCDRARSRCQGRQPRKAGAERSDAP